MNVPTLSILLGTLAALIGTVGTVRPPHWAPRWWHHFYAVSHCYFWLPCPLCGNHTGGHEWRDYKGLSSSIPDPEYPPNSGRGIGICQDCTRAGRGQPEPFIDMKEQQP